MKKLSYNDVTLANDWLARLSTLTITLPSDVEELELLTEALDYNSIMSSPRRTKIIKEAAQKEHNYRFADTRSYPKQR